MRFLYKIPNFQIILFYWEIRDLNQSLLESSLQYETKNDLNCQTDWQTRLFLFGFLLMIIVRIIEVFIGTIKMDDKLVMYEILSVGFLKKTIKSNIFSSHLERVLESCLLVSLFYTFS